MCQNLQATVCRIHYSKWIAFICVVVCLGFYVFVSFKSKVESRKTSEPEKRKLILDWTTFFGQRLEDGPTLNQLGCDVTTCDLTNDRSLVQQSDAVVFLWRHVRLKEMPQKGDRQRWILRIYESPLIVPRNFMESLNDSFDWTVSFRLDSDIPSSYGMIRRRKSSDPLPEPIINRKSFSRKKDIAWMTSDCNPPSKRDFLVSELERFVDVDIYGTCHGGDLSLRRMSKDEGFKYLSKRYKLYLSFENSVCRDYATEKVFMPLHYGLIPVVWGGANYPQILPPNSFIDVKNFSTIEELASHLKKVIHDYDLYSSHFEWRKEYYLKYRNIHSEYLCDICAKLYSDRKFRVKRDVTLTSWWDSESDCVKVRDPPLFLPSLRESINGLYKKLWV